MIGPDGMKFFLPVFLTGMLAISLLDLHADIIIIHSECCQNERERFVIFSFGFFPFLQIRTKFLHFSYR